MTCQFFIFSKMSAVQARQIANAVSVLEKFAKKGMVGSQTTSMDAKKRKTGGSKTKKPAAKKATGGKKRKTTSKKK